MPHFPRSILPALAMALCTTGALAANASNDNGNPESGVSRILLQTDHTWDGTKYKSYPPGQPVLTVVEFNLPPNTTLPWHYHPMPNAVYVVRGTLCIETLDGKHKTKIHAGDVLPELVGTVHHGRSGDTPVVMLGFYAGAAGQLTAVQPKRSPHIHPEALPAQTQAGKLHEKPVLHCSD